MVTMLKHRLGSLSLGMVLGVFVLSEARAAMAVVDVRAIAQMAQQVSVLRDQLSTIRNQLTQAQQLYQSVTGTRGMEQLLPGVARNYLPPDWAALTNTLDGLSSTYSALASELNGIINQNASISSEQLASLSQAAQTQIRRERQMAAMNQVMSREALSNTSRRFASIQQLIDAIPRANDQKAVLDLQARIGAEQAMLQNEQTKLQMLHQSLQAEEVSRKQRLRERAIADIGSLRDLEPLRLP